MVFLSSCGIVKRTSLDDDMRILDTGIASWYGSKFHGRPTANGETYNMNDLTAAHRTLPFNTMLRVENLDNGKSVVVRINDRGPYVGNRIIDLSRKSAREIDMIGTGTARVALYLIREGDRPVTSQNVSSMETFTVQIASFNREPDAKRQSESIPGSRVEKVTIGSNIVYRVYYGTYRNVNEARTARDRLAQDGINGFVKQMEN
ncbi:MAG: septal ring lytic transglycosylase RlpA family protein [Balneolaceae bacterium]|nr:MAG: septal ring lytic transglycosylase RlpA family protein [Balneolaceae bacterium]